MKFLSKILDVENYPDRLYFVIIFFVAILSFLAMINGVTTESLHLDEGFFVRNLGHYPDGVLIGSAPSAPIFYYASFAMSQIFGNAEWVYRIIPLIGAVAGMFLLALFVWKEYEKPVAAVSIVLFLTSVPWLDYAGFAHPYTIDIFWAVVLIIKTITLRREFTIAKWITWIVLAVIAIAFSYPALFFVTVYGALFTFEAIFAKHYQQLKILLLGLFPLFFYSLILLLFVFLKQASSIQTFFMDNHPDWFIQSFNPVHVFEFLYKNTVGIYEYLFFSYLGGITGVFLFILGCGWMTMKKRIFEMFVFIFPLGITIIAAFLEKWPYIPERMMIFSLPIFLLMMIEGLSFIWNKADSKTLKPFVFLAMICLLVPQSYVLKTGLSPIKESDVAFRTLSREIEIEIQDTDRFIVYYGSEVLFRYYLPAHVDQAVLQGWEYREQPEDIYQFVYENVNDYSGRIWMIFSNINPNEDEIMIDAVLKNRELLNKYEQENCQAYLFEHLNQVE